METNEMGCKINAKSYCSQTNLCPTCGHYELPTDDDSRQVDLVVSRNPLLTAVQAAYRKHHLDDDSIGCDELSNILLDALCNEMGDRGYQEWLKSVSG